MNAPRLQQAREIAAAAFAEAARRDIHNISVVITDAGGGIVLAQRADTQGAFGIATARAKAQSALGFMMSTARLSQIFSGNAAACAGIQAAVGGCFIPIGGAVVLVDTEGAALGAASISGGNPEADDQIIRVAVASLGLHALE